MRFEVVLKANRLKGRRQTTDTVVVNSPPSRDAGVKAEFLIQRHGSPEAALGFAQERLFYHEANSRSAIYWRAVAAVLKRLCTGKQLGDHRRGRGRLTIERGSNYHRVPEFARRG